MSLKIAFLGAKDIGAFCLRQLVSSASELGFEVAAVRSRKGANGAPVVEIAEAAGIPVLASLADLPKVDIIYSVQHHELLRQQDIDKARKIAVNLHLAPLPEYRGCNQFSFAILEEAKTFGVTIHQIDTRIDHGAVLFEQRFPIPHQCWVKELHELAVSRAQELFVSTLPRLISGDYRLQPQEEMPGSTHSRLYFREEIQQLKEISLDLPGGEIARRIRATMMPGFEPPYCRVAGRKVYFSDREQ